MTVTIDFHTGDDFHARHGSHSGGSGGFVHVADDGVSLALHYVDDAHTIVTALLPALRQAWHANRDAWDDEALRSLSVALRDWLAEIADTAAQRSHDPVPIGQATRDRLSELAGHRWDANPDPDTNDPQEIDEPCCTLCGQSYTEAQSHGWGACPGRIPDRLVDDVAGRGVSA